jgi:hypothetical protein
MMSPLTSPLSLSRMALPITTGGSGLLLASSQILWLAQQRVVRD